MKIINKEGCFIQKSDLECIIYNDTNLSGSLHYKIALMINKLKNDEYFKIDDEEILNYILTCDFIASYDELNIKNIDEIYNAINVLNNIKKELDYCHSTDIKNIIEWQKEIKYNNYLLEQYNNILLKKMNFKENNLPNIKDDDVKSVSNGKLSAFKTLSNKIIVYSNNNEKINKIDKYFCNIAYKILMDKHNDLQEDETFNYILSSDNSSIVVEIIVKQDVNKNVKRKIKKK